MGVGGTRSFCFWGVSMTLWGPAPLQWLFWGRRTGWVPTSPFPKQNPAAPHCDTARASLTKAKCSQIYDNKSFAAREGLSLAHGHMASKGWDGIRTQVSRFPDSSLSPKTAPKDWNPAPYELTRWHSSKGSTCLGRRHRRCGFNPWVRKIPQSRTWQLTPVFLPGKFHGQRSLVGYGDWAQAH